MRIALHHAGMHANAGPGRTNYSPHNIKHDKLRPLVVALAVEAVASVECVG